MNITAIIKNAKGRNEMANETISAMRKNVETLQDALENWNINTAKKAAESTLRQHNKWERAIQADRMDTREVYTTEYRDNKELEEIVDMDNEMVKDLTKVQGETAKVVRDIRDAHKIAKIESAMEEEAQEAAAIEAAAKKAETEEVAAEVAAEVATEETAAEVQVLREQLKKAEAERDEARAEVKALREQLNEAEEVHAEAAESEDKTETAAEDDEIEKAVLHAKDNDARAQKYMEEMKMNIERARGLLADVLSLKKSDATKLVRENNKIAKRYNDTRTGELKDLALKGKVNDAVRECMDMEENTQSDMYKLQRETKDVADEIRRIAA